VAYHGRDYHYQLEWDVLGDKFTMASGSHYGTRDDLDASKRTCQRAVNRLLWFAATLGDPEAATAPDAGQGDESK
jgi:hypothetical protein